MSEPSSSVPRDGQAAARHSAGTGGALSAFLCWLVLLAAIAVFAAVSFIRSEHRAQADLRYALAGEQRSVAAATTALAEDLATGTVPAASRVAALRARSLELLARIPSRPVADLPAEWERLATGLDFIEAQWARILEFQAGVEALRGQARDLREDSERLGEVLAGAGVVPPGRAEALAITSRQFVGELDRSRPTDPAGLERARELLEVHARVRGFLAAELARQPAAAPRTEGTPVPNPELAAIEPRLDAVRKRLDGVLSTAVALESVSAEIRQLAEGSARVVALLPKFDARSGPAPTLLGHSFETWLLGSASLALAGLLGLFRRHGRLLRAEAARLDRAWGEAAESDWRARGLVRDLLRAIHSLDRRGTADGAPKDHGDLEGSVREATASLPRIVARRAQIAAALLSARESLRSRLAAARDAVLAHLGAGRGELDPTPLLELERTFREATLFAMAALVREIRATVSEHEFEPVPGETDPAEAIGATTLAGNAPETVRGVAARAFDLLEAGLERVLAGEEEGHAAFLFLLDDLRVVRGKAPFSSSLDFDPDLTRPAATGASRAGGLRTDAARMLPTFRKGLLEWAAGFGDGNSAAKLMRGSASVLARAAEDAGLSEGGFWSAAAAFCAALCERAIPAGPAVRRLLEELAETFEETAEREDRPPPPDRLLRDLLIYIALAESDHEELGGVRTAFELERHPLAIPGPHAETGLGGDTSAGLSEDLIQQLEGIKAALDRIDRPSETPPGPPPAP